MNNVNKLVDRYVAIWNEADDLRRRDAVRELWTEDAVHLLEAPQAVRESASDLDVLPIFQVRGHDELEARVKRAYEKFVAPGELSFRSQSNGKRLADLVRFHWEMVNTKGEVLAVGLEVIQLSADGRIRLDYQFIET